MGQPITDRAVLATGVAGDFRHPEALAYVDSMAYAACDRHHQEILLPGVWCDEEDHTLVLHGWSGGTHLLRFDGRSVRRQRNSSERLWMGECALVQIDQPTRDFVALGIAGGLTGNEPAGAHLYKALDESFKLTGAESLARQFLLGRQFFKKYFGDEAESSVLWLPDRVPKFEWEVQIVHKMTSDGSYEAFIDEYDIDAVTSYPVYRMVPVGRDSFLDEWG